MDTTVTDTSRIPERLQSLLLTKYIPTTHQLFFLNSKLQACTCLLHGDRSFMTLH